MVGVDRYVHSERYMKLFTTFWMKEHPVLTSCGKIASQQVLSSLDRSSSTNMQITDFNETHFRLRYFSIKL